MQGVVPGGGRYEFTALMPLGERFRICTLPFPTRPKFCDDVTARSESLYGLKDSELALKGSVWNVYGIAADGARGRAERHVNGRI